jgi:arylsulfatase A-like enzyme
VITADHGEHLGEHHLLGHKFSVYNPLVRVPLVIRYPKGLPPGRVAQVVSNLSVLATVAELAGVPAPEGTLSKSLLHLEQHDGAAFSELMHATPQALDRMSDVFPDLDWQPFLRTYATVETADAKCIVASDGSRQVYEMPGDLLEVNDVATVDPARTDALCGRIPAWRATFPAYDPSLATVSDTPKKKYDRKTRERLEALGYLEKEQAPEPP